MFAFLRDFMDLAEIPLAFFPAPVQQYLSFVTGFFWVFVVGRLLKWLWDILPVA